MVDDAEVEVFEEGGDAGEEADALDAGGFGLIEEGANERPPAPCPLMSGRTTMERTSARCGP